MTKTMSIRMDKENYEFISELSKEEKGDLSKAVRDLLGRGRVMLAVEKYRSKEASLGRTAFTATYGRANYMAAFGPRIPTAPGS